MNTQPTGDSSHSSSVESPTITAALDSDAIAALSSNVAGLPDVDSTPDVQQALARKTAACNYLNRQLQEANQERQQLEAQLQWHEDSERVLAAVAELDYQSHHLSQNFQEIVSQVQAVLQADRACLYRLQADQSSFVMAEAVRSEWMPILGFLIRDTFVSSPAWIERYQKGQICSIPDLTALNLVEDRPTDHKIASLDAGTNTLLHYFQVKAKLVLPILVHQQLWGLLVIHQCAAPRYWQEMEINFLKRLAWQLGMAIAQQKLYQELQKLEDRFSIQRQNQAIRLRQTLEFEALLTRITDRVRNSLDEQQILQTALQELTMVLGVHCCQAVLCDPVQATCGIQFEYYAPINDSGQWRPRSQRPSVDTIPQTAEFCHQIHQGEPFQFCLTEPFLNHGQETILIVPILDDQGCLGSLRLFTQQSHNFDASELRLVQQVANHCAIAVRQARLFQASQTQVKAMERLHQLKDDFLSTISHELRTPLSSIKMVTNLLKLAFKLVPGAQIANPGQTSSEAESTKVAQYLKVLEEECDREISLIDDLLSTQHLNAGSHPISLMPIQLQEWIPHIAETFAQRLQTHQQTLALSVPADLPPLMADTFMLNRILVELLNNACKYTPSGGSITVAASHTSSRIEITVKNSGVEIAADELTHVFDPFYRIPNNDPWKQSGTGLGLSLTRKLVEYLGGTIQAESTPNQVCFKVQFPLTTLEI